MALLIIAVVRSSPSVGLDQGDFLVPIADGERVYSSSCVECHGRDGRAKTAKGKRTGATDLTSDWNADEARVIRIIRNGRGEMPAFRSKLSANQIKEVYQFVVKFRHSNGSE